MLVGERKWHVSPPAIEIVDTVSAGDAGIAGLIYALIQDSEKTPVPSAEINWFSHLQFSVVCGSAACLTAGAKPPQLAQVITLLNSILAPIFLY